MTNRLDDKISAFVLELVDDPPAAPDIDFEAAKDPVPNQLHRTPPQRRASVPVVAIAGAALLILIAVGLPVLLFSGGSEVVDEPTTTTVVTTTTPPSTTAAPSPLSLPDAWQRVGASVMRPVVGIFDMVETSSGLLAVGFDPGEEDSRQNGVIFASSDGVTWNRLAEDDPALNLGALLIYGVTEGGPGLVAVGQGCEDDAEACALYPTVWTSVDGTSWDRSPPNPDVFGQRAGLLDVVSTEHGLIAAGALYPTLGDSELAQPTVWLSSDGIDWERVWQDEAYDFSEATTLTGFQALTTDADGLVVGVGTAVNDDGTFVGAIWRSTDGRTWERIDQNSEVFASKDDSDVSIFEVASGPGGFVAVGSDGGTEVAIWHSPDGLTWTRADTAEQPFEYIGTLSAVDALGAGWVVAGPHGFADIVGGTVTLWTSPDGLTWDRVHSIDPGYAMSVVATDSGIAVAGAMAGVDNYYATVWAGPSFDPLAPPPDSGPPPRPIPETLPDGGLSCEELLNAGYGYQQVLSYWIWYERPADLDPDGSGMPCANVFPTGDVEAVFGGPEALRVEIALDVDAGTFAAVGPAVDAGLVCSSGTTEDGRILGDDTLDERAIRRWDELWTCDDGSGSFTFGVDAFFVVEGQRLAGVGNIVSGAGDYLTVTGAGGYEFVGGTEWTSRWIARVWLAEEAS